MFDQGAQRDPKFDYGEDDELHVQIEGDRWEDVNAAAEMVNRLLVPVDEDMNEHKRMQLKARGPLGGIRKRPLLCSSRPPRLFWYIHNLIWYIYIRPSSPCRCCP